MIRLHEMLNGWMVFVDTDAEVDEVRQNLDGIGADILDVIDREEINSRLFENQRYAIVVPSVSRKLDKLTRQQLEIVLDI